MDADQELKSLKRGLKAMMLINRQGSLAISELSRGLDLPRTTAERVLMTLLAEGFVDRDSQTKRFFLTGRVRALSGGYSDESSIAHVAAPLLFETTSAMAGLCAGGFEISLGCDFMIIADEAQVGDVHTDAGVVPACVTQRLVRRVGLQNAKEILWGAKWYKGPEAVAIGLAIKSVPLATLRDEAIDYAKGMTDKPRETIAVLKRLMSDGAQLSTADGATMELAAFGHYNRTQPFGKEGYTAFREKREPRWKAT